MVDSVTGGLVTVIRHDREANLVVIACRFGSVIATVTRFSLFDDDHDHAQKHDHGPRSRSQSKIVMRYCDDHGRAR
eukprot:2229737-Prymnesium_polylepis.2